jgi:predicted transcriptional regulator
MDTLAQYLKTHGVTQEAFAAQIGTSQGYVAKLVNGTRSPRLSVAQRIQDATKGAVPITGWDHLKAVVDAAKGDAA